MRVINNKVFLNGVPRIDSCTLSKFAYGSLVMAVLIMPPPARGNQAVGEAISKFNTKENAITFFDIGLDADAGIDYERHPSASAAYFSQFEQQPLILDSELVASPLKSRGAPGVAVWDYDNDGDMDIYVTNGPGVPNGLYQNQYRENNGQVIFKELAISAGVDATSQDSSGVCYGDIDNDGDSDLMVLGNGHENRLFENNGDGSFNDITMASGVAGDRENSTACSMGDIDNNGLLDLVVANTFDMRTHDVIFNVGFEKSQHNVLYKNMGDNIFGDISRASGFNNNALMPATNNGLPTLSWAIAMVDYDLDGDIDIMQADDQGGFPGNAFGGSDRGYIQLFENNGEGVFNNVTFERNLNKLGTWMGLAYGDFNRDGHLDVFVSNFGDSGLDSRWFFQTPGTKIFMDSAESDGIFPLGSVFGWGASAPDYDNDGDTDIIYHGGMQSTAVLVTNPGAVLNNNGVGQFSRDLGAFPARTHNPIRRNVQGLAVGDINNDGFTDVVSVSSFDIYDDTPFINGISGGEFAFDSYEVEFFKLLDAESGLLQWGGYVLPNGSLSVAINSASNGNNWTQLKLVGSIGITQAGRVNRDAIGAVIKVTRISGEVISVQPVLGGASYASQDSLLLTVGMGQENQVNVEIIWPGGLVSKFFKVKKGERLIIPEIPCDASDQAQSFRDYLSCVIVSLQQLYAGRIVNSYDNLRFLMTNALRARLETQFIKH